MPSRSSHVRTIVTTIISFCIVIVVLAFVGVKTGVMPANADAKPGQLETWAGKRSLHATLDREARSLQSPVPVTDSTEIHGVRLYGAYCAVCHGASDGKASAVARGLYQHAPQFAKHDVADDPIGITYWKITHGIRFTGMPAFDSTLSSNERWTIATFLAHQDSLTPRADTAWRALPSSVEQVK